MAKSRTAILLGILAALPLSATAGPVAPKPGLEIAIVPARDVFRQLYIPLHERFKIVFTNRSDQPIRLWDPWCQPAYTGLSFRVTDNSGDSWTMLWHNPASSDDDDEPVRTGLLAPGASFTWKVQLGSYTRPKQDGKRLPEPNTREEITLAAVFESKADAKTKKHSAWTGRIESAPVRVTIYNPELRTPHQYLWNGCPKQALKIMKADPTWVNKQDREDYCTPLHHAVRFGHAEVVAWLLANGAALNVKAYNDFTPLYFADDPKVLRLLLEYMPRDKARAAEFFRYPLEHAASQVDWGGDDAAKWRQVVKLMLDAGAPYRIQVAVHLNDIDRIRAILKENPELATDAGSSQSPLRIAASQGHIEICKLLLEQKADPDDLKGGVFPILVGAVKHPALVKLLLDAGADVKRRITWNVAGRTGPEPIVGEGATFLHYAAEAGSVESARLLVERGVKVEAQDDHGKTALHIAAVCGEADVVRFLLGSGASPATRTQDNRTALEFAVDGGNPNVVQALLESKLFMDSLRQDGAKLMAQAAKLDWHPSTKEQRQRNAGALAIINLLHARGVAMDIDTAIAADNIARVKMLLESKSAVVKDKDGQGLHLLHRAALFNRTEIATLLLDHGVDVNGLDQEGETALHIAAYWAREKITAMLIARKANVNARSTTGWTPLHAAACGGETQIAKLLLAAGADTTAKHKEGKTPLIYAEEAYRTAPVLIELLRKHGRQKKQE